MEAVAFVAEGCELVGSDSVFYCDGRWSLNTCINKAKEHFRKNNINNEIIGFRLTNNYINDFKETTYITNLILL